MDKKLILLAYVIAGLSGIERGLSWLLQIDILGEYLMLQPATLEFQVAQLGFAAAGVGTVYGAAMWSMEGIDG
jgi:hypothetical protein